MCKRRCWDRSCLIFSLSWVSHSITCIRALSEPGHNPIGMAFFAAGLNTQESSFQTTAASTSSSLLILSTAGLIIPAAYHASRLESLGSVGVDDTVGLLALSRGTALVLLICYGACEFCVASGLGFGRADDDVGV